ncbi:unnamed protein product [Angiostrongylus costaricensis]|uniref:FMN hydroxy acid dehydrogenase domain-containing protein n=1 Tax=Angiostrongylus costaricensis TaxID=334426 RepID=A0A158PK46_ANGCS|nr:unnamed protein product [Angiostrongylus costaricensis]
MPGYRNGQRSLLTVDDFRLEAALKLSKMASDYYEAGADEQLTLARNENAYRRLLIRPRCLQDVSKPDTSVGWFGRKHSFPIGIAPTAFHRMAHKSGELSTLYVYKERSIASALVCRAEQSGYKAIVLTVDTPVLGRRLIDARNGFTLPDGLNTKVGESGFMHYVSSQIDSTLDWSVVDWLLRTTRLPVLVKGIMRGDDADEAVRRGVQGIIVSNHGGRQIDSAPATIEVLPEVVRAVLGRVPVFIDGGIRNGRDIFKSIALGASGVFVGRPILWGLSVDVSLVLINFLISRKET